MMALAIVMAFPLMRLAVGLPLGRAVAARAPFALPPIALAAFALTTLAAFTARLAFALTLRSMAVFMALIGRPLSPPVSPALGAPATRSRRMVVL